MLRRCTNRIRAALLALTLLLGSGPAFTTDIPDWVLHGILNQETRSYYDIQDGEIVYVDRRIGRHGERGPFQMTKIAFDTIRQPGERFERLHTDPEFAEQLAKRYLTWLYQNKGQRNWTRTLACYNAGTPRKKAGWRYAAQVEQRGRALAMAFVPPDPRG
jgi:hypothetical protein